MKLLEIPKLFCPFSCGDLTPETSVISNHLTKWMVDYELVRSLEQLDFYMSQNYAAMITISYPYADQDVRIAWCDLNCLLFCLDDILDEQTEVDSIAQLDEIEKSFLLIIDGKQPELNTPILKAFGDFWERFKKYSPLSWQQEFRGDIEKMFYGGRWQFNGIRNNHTLSYDEYLSLRGFLGAGHLATNSLPITANIPSGHEMFKSEKVQYLNQTAQALICFANDLFSYGKEAQKSFGGAQFNLVSVVANNYGLSIDNAIEKAAVIHDDKMREFVRCAQALVKESIFDEFLEKYINALGALMSGNIIWSTKYSTRYPHIYRG